MPVKIWITLCGVGSILTYSAGLIFQVRISLALQVWTQFQVEAFVNMFKALFLYVSARMRKEFPREKFKTGPWPWLPASSCWMGKYPQGGSEDSRSLVSCACVPCTRPGGPWERWTGGWRTCCLSKSPQYCWLFVGCFNPQISQLLWESPGSFSLSSNMIPFFCKSCSP